MKLIAKRDGSPRGVQIVGPTPGGGSAAALAGAVGSSLLAMVAGLPKSRAATRRGSRPAEGRRRAVRGAQPPSSRRSIDRDSDAYDLVMAAYKKPEGDRRGEGGAIRGDPGGDARGDRRAARRDAGLRRRRRTRSGDRRRSGIRRRRATRSVGFELLGAGLRGAKLNVEINLGSVKDADYAAKVRSEVEELERAIGHETEAAEKRGRS